MSEYMAIPNAVLHWMSLGNCYDNDQVHDFQAMGMDPFYDKTMPTHIAKRICKDCIVKYECKDYAIKNNEPGIWGGLTEKERREEKQILNRKIKKFLARTGHEVLLEPKTEQSLEHEPPSVA